MSCGSRIKITRPSRLIMIYRLLSMKQRMPLMVILSVRGIYQEMSITMQMKAQRLRDDC